MLALFQSISHTLRLSDGALSAEYCCSSISVLPILDLFTSVFLTHAHSTLSCSLFMAINWGRSKSSAL